MKPGFIFLASISAIAGWLYLELAPVPEGQRMAEFQQLPGVRNVVEWNDLRLIRSRFDDAEGEPISVTRGGVTSTWTTVEEWQAAYDAFDRNARYFYNEVKTTPKIQKAETRRARARQQDDEPGQIEQLRDLAMLGVGNTGDGQSLATLLRQGSSPMSQPSLQSFMSETMDLNSREGMLQMAKSLASNERLAGMSDAEYDQQTRRSLATLGTLKARANSGDEDARWIVARLHGDTEVRVRVPN